MTVPVEVRLFLTWGEVNKTSTQFSTAASSPQGAQCGRRQGLPPHPVQSFDCSSGGDMLIAGWSQYLLLKVTLGLSLT